MGDVNIHLERDLDPDRQKFCRLIDSYDLMQMVDEPTHERGGLLDIVLTSDPESISSLEVTEVGLSDHSLVHWTLSTTGPPPPTYTKIRRRKWSGFRLEEFLERIKRTQLCRPVDPNRSTADLAESFSAEVTTILDELAPFTELSLRDRPSRPFYDADCRNARREARRFERAFRKARGTDAQEAAHTRWRTALKASRTLVRRKGRHYWRNALNSTTGDPKQTWRHLDSVLGSDTRKSRQQSSFTASDYHQFLDRKVAEIRSKTAEADPPEFQRLTSAVFDSFVPPTIEEVVSIVRNAPCKQCKADPMPMWLLKESIDTVAPYLATLMATSFRTSEFPERWKEAVVHPHLKQPGLDQAEPCNYRPVSNLPFFSKLAERLVNNRLVRYLNENGLLPKNQSAYRRGHSTETAVLRIVNDLTESAASGRLALICLLDLSAAFDTVDHGILYERLERSYGLKGAALEWIRNYLVGRSQSVSWMGCMSTSNRVQCGVPQGSVLGPLLFILYTADIGCVIEGQGFTMHAYADDVQAYSSCQPSEAGVLRSRAETCIAAVKAWTDQNRLSLNPSKTEFLWLTTPRKRHLIDRSDFVVEGVVIAPSRQLRLLGVLLDESLTFEEHLNNIIRSSYYHLRRIRQVRRYLPTSAATDLVRALVVARVDYCNSVLYGVPHSQLNRLQAVLNVSARLIYRSRWGAHITPLLKDRLHWLRIRERVAFKRHWLTYRALNDPHCPTYLSELIVRTTAIERRSILRSGHTAQLVVPPPLRTAGLGDRSFRRGNPASWNLLPKTVTTESLPERFRKQLFNSSFL